MSVEKADLASANVLWTRLLSDGRSTSDSLLVEQMITEITQLRDDKTELVDALEWYSERATAMHRYLSAKPPKTDAVIAVTTELSLDNGQRALLAKRPPHPAELVEVMEEMPKQLQDPGSKNPRAP